MNKKILLIPIIVVALLIGLYGTYYISYKVGRKFYNEGNSESAIKYLKIANYSSFSSDETLHEFLAYNYMVNQDYKKSIDIYQNNIDRNINRSKNYKLIGLAYYSWASSETDIEKLRIASDYLIKSKQLNPDGFTRDDEIMLDLIIGISGETR